MDLVHFVDEQKPAQKAAQLVNGEVRLTDEYFTPLTPQLTGARVRDATWDSGDDPVVPTSQRVREDSVDETKPRMSSFSLGDAAHEGGEAERMPSAVLGHYGERGRDSVGVNINSGESVEVASNFHLGCFALCGMGATVAYTAILSSLVWYKALFGPSIFLLLNISVYAPALPVMLLQNSFDENYNAKHGVRNAYRFRVSFCFAGLVCVLSLFAAVRPKSSSMIVLATLVVGLFAGVAYGTFYQIISLMPDPRCNAVFAMGYQGVGLLVLAVGLASGFNQDAAEGAAVPMSEVGSFFGGCAFIQLVCLWAFLSIDGSCKMYAFAVQSKDEALAKRRMAKKADREERVLPPRLSLDIAVMGAPEQMHEPLLRYSMSELSQQEEGVDLTGSPSEQEANKTPGVSRWTVFCAIWPCAAACSLTICGSIMLFPFYVYLQDAEHNASLPQVLFFTKLTADAISRPLTMYLKLVRTPKQLLGLALLRTLFVPVFFVYVATDALGEWNILWLVLAIAIYSFFSGYIITTSYHMAPRMLDPSLGDDVARIMSVLFQAGLVMALLSALALQHALSGSLGK